METIIFNESGSEGLATLGRASDYLHNLVKSGATHLAYCNDMHPIGRVYHVLEPPVTVAVVGYYTTKNGDMTMFSTEAAGATFHIGLYGKETDIERFKSGFLKALAG